MSKVEKAYNSKIQADRTGAEIDPTVMVTAEQIRNSDKSKIRSVKEKVKVIMKLSYQARSQMMTPYWNAKIEALLEDAD